MHGERELQLDVGLPGIDGVPQRPACRPRLPATASDFQVSRQEPKDADIKLSEDIYKSAAGGPLRRANSLRWSLRAILPVDW